MADTIPCPKCGGRGEVTYTDLNDDQIDEVCRKCGGDGQIWTDILQKQIECTGADSGSDGA